MSLLSLQSASLALGDAPLLAQAQLSIASGERIGLIGRNGTGKSTLLKVLAGWVPLDDGQRLVKPQLALSYVAQEPELNDEDTVFEAVNKGLKDLHRAMAQYSRGEGDLHQLQNQIEARDGWHWQQRVDETLTRLRLHGDQKIKHLSGGTRKRVALGQALVASPDLLLLDEPFGALDAFTREELWCSLRDIQAERYVTVIGSRSASCLVQRVIGGEIKPLITLEHTAQDLPSRLADILSVS